MLKFIVCEDNEIIRKKNISVINKVMFSNNVNYNIFEFNSYNNDLLDIINDNSGRKVFILDIELGSKSGIDIARLIRKNDWESFIIISTAHYELFPQVFKDRLMLFDFISKFDDYSNNLYKSLNQILNIYLENHDFVFKIRNDQYKLKYNEILYLFFDKVERKTLIKTKDKEFKVSKPLNTLSTQLPNEFIKINRSLIINSRNIKNYSVSKNQLIFNNNEIIKNITLNKKELMNYVLD